MKKFVSLLVVLCLALAMVPAMADEDLLGEWYLTDVVIEESSFPASIIGLSMTLTLNEDGTCSMISVDEEGEDVSEGTWTAIDGGVSIEIDEETLDCLLEDGQLKADMDYMILVLSRELPEAVELPATVAAETEDEFFGEWQADSIFVEDMLLPVSVLDIELTVTIEAGQITLISSDEPDDATVMETVFSEGTLVATMEEEDLTETVVLELNDAGGLVLTQFVDEEPGMIFYFVPVEEE